MAGGDRKNANGTLVAALAGGATIAEAAERGGVSQRTVYRRLEDADFRAAVQQARAELVTQAVARLAEAGGEAVATLRALLGEGTPPAVRLGAARAVLELGTRLRESEELERRLSELEATLETQQASGRAGRWR